ncbi:MAG TPA: hypothetical protein VG227_05900 [Caulobacteraceae bacterium]|nr:hypothetical protein [Caulobacteraceae bacterium]
MSAAVLSFPPPVETDDREALIAIVTELHALITLDRAEGSSPTRIYFVIRPQGKREVAARLKPADAHPTPEMYALIAYDFPFALFQFEMAGAQISRERAKEIIAANAELQEDVLAHAAAVVGLGATPVQAFDAEGLKAAFFPSTQESVVHVLRLSRAQDLRARA